MAEITYTYTPPTPIQFINVNITIGDGVLISTEEEDWMVLVNTTDGRCLYFIGRIREYEAAIYLKALNGAVVGFGSRKELRLPNPLDRLLYL